MTVDELINFLNEHPMRGDYEVVVADKLTEEVTSQLWSDSLEWNVAGKRFILNYD